MVGHGVERSGETLVSKSNSEFTFGGGFAVGVVSGNNIRYFLMLPVGVCTVYTNMCNLGEDSSIPLEFRDPHCITVLQWR